MSTEAILNRIARQNNLLNVDTAFGTVSRNHVARFAAEEAAVADGAAREDRRYLIASITKPIVAMCVLRLAAEGYLSLTQRVRHLLPEFSKAAYRRITIHHLLTHTSGFPDMLPDNQQLRASHAPLADYLSKASIADLEFSTATECRYSSVGFLLLGPIVEKICGETLGEFLQKHFFQPLHMTNTQLGLSEIEADEFLPTVLPCVLPDWLKDAEDWDWNSRYWRSLGAPWGGMMSSAGDLGRYAAMMLSDGCAPTGQQVLPPEVVRAAIANQSLEYESQPEFCGARRAWGLGWRRQWNTHAASFGDYVSPQTYGHWGATGTTMWMDPSNGRYAVILTTTPYEDSQWAIQQISNVLAVR